MRPGSGLLACLVVMMFPPLALANGGVTVHQSGGAVGRIFPQGQTAVRLIHEKLDIYLGTSVAVVTATYKLSNPGDEAEATYAVPIVLPRRKGGPSEITTRAEEIAKSIMIFLGGKQHTCVYQPRTGPEHLALQDLDVMGRNLTRFAVMDGLCVTTLRLPKSTDIDLELTYSTPLFTEELDACDPQTGKCQRDAPSQPVFYYPMGAASSWAGRPQRIDVKVELDGCRLDLEHSKGIPADAVVKSKNLRWTWIKPDMVGLDFLLALKAKGHKGIELELGSSPGAMEGKAVRWSSHLPPEKDRSYDPSKLTDALAATAWCVNTPKQGVGEWVELEFRFDPSSLGWLSHHERDHKARHNSFAGVHILPGLGASQRLWEANGRVKKIHVTTCEQSNPGVDGVVPISDGFREGVVEVPDVRDFVLNALLDTPSNTVCLRVEIKEVVPGTRSKDVCIGELAVAVRNGF